MAQVSPEVQHQFGLIIGSIPETVRKAIDEVELLDRLTQANGLIRKAQQARTPGEGRQLGEEAQRILQARPRAETESIVLAKMAKARIIDRKDQADALVRQAREELIAHQPAVRRNAAPVAKVKADEPEPDQLMAVYDRNGNLTHVGFPKDLTPVQAPDSGPVKAGGTTDMGPAKQGAAPKPLPGDVPGRQVVKSVSAVERLAEDIARRVVADPRVRAAARAAGSAPARQPVVKAKPATPVKPAPEQVIKSLGPEWMPVHDYTGHLAGAVPKVHVTKQALSGAEARTHANVYDARGRRCGGAPLSEIVVLADLLARRRR